MQNILAETMEAMNVISKVTCDEMCQVAEGVARMSETSCKEEVCMMIKILDEV